MAYLHRPSQIFDIGFALEFSIYFHRYCLRQTTLVDTRGLENPAQKILHNLSLTIYHFTR